METMELGDAELHWDHVAAMNLGCSAWTMSTLPGRDTIKKPQLASCAFEVVVGLLYKDVTASRVILRLVLMEMKKNLKRGPDVPHEEPKKKHPRKKQ
eukprot:s4180_g1.t1